MAISPVIRGLAQVYVDTGDQGDFEPLGLTRNGVQFSDQRFVMPIPSDENGGDEGPPVDFVWLGMILRMEMEFTTWDDEVRKKLVHGYRLLQGDNLGIIKPAGMLLLAGGRSFKFRIQSKAEDRSDGKLLTWTFGRCTLVREPISHNWGRRYSTLRIVAEAWRDPTTGELWKEELLTP
jgi:hypothetical protein